MEMRKKQFRPDRVALLGEVLAEKTDAAAGVEYEAAAARDYLDTRCVTAVAGSCHSRTRH
jgi:hypothetical protein